MEDGKPVKRIVVGLDGSDHAAAALQYAVRMARGMNADIVAVYAVNTPIDTYPSGFGTAMVPPELDPRWRSEMKQEMEDVWCRQVRDAGVLHTVVMEDGRPATVIAAVADRLDADVVVVGRRGRGAITELLLGSVSHELAHHCKRPVLLIPRTPVAREEAVTEAAAPAVS